MFKANQVVLDLLQKIANEKEATIAQVSLAWLLAQRDWIVPIPGTTKLSRIDENVGATSIHFSKQELNDINHAVDQLEIVGDRYNQEQKKKTGK
ncbi:aldo/keto reductase [Trichococcus sp. K1Tr]|uniref:aldo/keto reductase n=1 Tax=Trichococcus sp. K1Tr TaxID=3020847 RepID=UPI00232DF66C|nr:aldo/keto reductase [Trichococcus sp. K1Tr]MDB6354449.1 aldo/keto reductase [Trichococcus sp. K1Tr]